MLTTDEIKELVKQIDIDEESNPGARTTRKSALGAQIIAQRLQALTEELRVLDIMETPPNMPAESADPFYVGMIAGVSAGIYKATLKIVTPQAKSSIVQAKKTMEEFTTGIYKRDKNEINKEERVH